MAPSLSNDPGRGKTGVKACGFSSTSSEWVNRRKEHLGKRERGREHVRQSGTYWCSLGESGFTQPSLWIRGRERTALHSHLSSLIILRGAFFRDGPWRGFMGTSVPFGLNETCPCLVPLGGPISGILRMSRVKPYGLFCRRCKWCGRLWVLEID